ncbi:MAG TPA: hypothetical protein VMF35_07475 [Acidimicrobiales bacterium]|nr:hypothetical protein [Acidimicrobiales bacterium]
MLAIVVNVALIWEGDSPRSDGTLMPKSAALDVALGAGAGAVVVVVVGAGAGAGLGACEPVPGAEPRRYAALRDVVVVTVVVVVVFGTVVVVVTGTRR